MESESSGLDLKEALRRAHRREEKLCSERAVAEGFLDRLLGQPPIRRRWMIANSPSRVSWALVEKLLETALFRLPADPASAEDLAALAVKTVDHLGRNRAGGALSADLTGRAWAGLGLCQSAAGRLEAAGRSFRRAEAALLQGTFETLELVLFLDRRASYLACRGRTRAAEVSRSRAEALALQIGDYHQVGRMLVKQGVLLAHRRRWSSACEALEAGRGLLDPQLDPFLAFSAHLWIADCRTPARGVLQAKVEVKKAVEMERSLDPVLLDAAARRRAPIEKRVERALRGRPCGEPALGALWPAGL